MQRGFGADVRPPRRGSLYHNARRDVSELIIRWFLFAAAAVGILTTAGVLFSLVSETIAFFRIDARTVPLAHGTFDLDDYIDYVIAMFHHLGQGTHVMAVCQPSVPVLAAVALMSEDRDPDLPLTMTLMGGPIDTRLAPTAVNHIAEARGTEWFRRNTIMTVPFPHPGFMREVYPGFLQLSGFMSMNLDRHVTAHQEFYGHLVDGDGEPAEKHREFYDEYLAVMDLTAEFYLQTVETVFIRHDLPKGLMKHRGEPVDLKAIRSVAMLTVEGEHDDISGVGQTRAAHDLLTAIPADRRAHYMQPKVGHYGVFNGSRYRNDIQPRIADFIRKHGGVAHAVNGASKPIKAGRGVSERLADAMGITALNGKALPAVTRKMTDDLTAIIGIGPKMSDKLHELGIEGVRQLAELAEDGSPTQLIVPGPSKDHLGCALLLHAVDSSGNEIPDTAEVIFETAAPDGSDRQVMFKGSYGDFKRSPDGIVPAQQRGVAQNGYMIRMAVVVPEGDAAPDLEAEQSTFSVRCFKHLMTVSA